MSRKTELEDQLISVATANGSAVFVPSRVAAMVDTGVTSMIFDGGGPLACGVPFDDAIRMAPSWWPGERILMLTGVADDGVTRRVVVRLSRIVAVVPAPPVEGGTPGAVRHRPMNVALMHGGTIRVVDTLEAIVAQGTRPRLISPRG